MSTKSPPIPPSSRSPRSPALAQFDDPPRRPSEPGPEDEEPPFEAEAEPEADDEPSYPEPSSEQTLLPPPNFNPFFTLIEDSTSGEHYHPTVHYVFADDDPVIVTAAAMRSLGLDETRYLPQNTPTTEKLQGDEEVGVDAGGGEEGGDAEGSVESPLPPPIPGVKERYLIVDVAGDGHTIVDAQSLSSEWQITDSAVRPAPCFGEGSAEQGYMLRIEGIEVPGKSNGKGKGSGRPGDEKLKEARDRAGGDVFGALDGLVQSVEARLDVAGRIMGQREGTTVGGGESERTVSLGEGSERKKSVAEV